MKSWDDLNLENQLRACPSCGVTRWMHPAQTLCVRCHDKAEKAK